MKPHICVIGSYAVGMTVYTARFPVAGETVLGHDFAAFHGGKGSNQAIGAARHGAAVTMVSCVGNDDMGNRALAMMKDEGIDTSWVKRSPERSTGVGLIIVNDSGENEIVIDFGANNDLTPDDVDAVRDLIRSHDVVVLQLEVPVPVVERAIRIAAEEGTPVILNPAPYQDFDTTLLQSVGVVTPNETEARALYGPDAPENPVDLAAALHEQYGCTILMTWGARGAILANGDGTVVVPGREVTPIDTTGAGDAFNAAFAWQFARGVGHLDAARYANVAASMATTISGVVPSLPRGKEVNDIFEQMYPESGRSGGKG